jgi:hypothetical protein
MLSTLHDLAGKYVVVNLRGGQHYEGKLTTVIDDDELIEIESSHYTHRIRVEAVDAVTRDNNK